MTRKRANGPRITGPDVDLEREVIRDSKGQRVDQAYVERALAEVGAYWKKQGGRPSLTGEAKHSPHVSFRVTPELKAKAMREAEARGMTVSQLAREAFELIDSQDHRAPRPPQDIRNLVVLRRQAMSAIEQKYRHV